MEDGEINEVEEIVNEKILENLPVHMSTTTLDDAISKGVIAFWRKIRRTVRVVKQETFCRALRRNALQRNRGYRVVQDSL
jgi:alanyl-tRNA synthetase